MWTAVDHFRKGILAWTLGDHSAETFEPLWTIVAAWQCYFYVTDGWIVYPSFIPDGDQIISKTYMTRVEGENSRLRHYSGFQMSMSKVKWRENANRKSVFTGFERTSNRRLSKRKNHDE